MLPQDEFEWDEFNEGKLAARHGVDRYEAEEAATDTRAIMKRIGFDKVGNPEFMVGVRKRDRHWRIGSARDAEFREEKAYRKRNK